MVEQMTSKFKKIEITEEMRQEALRVLRAQNARWNHEPLLGNGLLSKIMYGAKNETTENHEQRKTKESRRKP